MKLDNLRLNLILNAKHLKNRSRFFQIGIIFVYFVPEEEIKPQRRTLRFETNFGNWKSFKNDEKYFLFHLKSSFRSQDI